MDAIFSSLEPGSLIWAHTISQSSKVHSKLLMSSFTSTNTPPPPTFLSFLNDRCVILREYFAGLVDWSNLRFLP